MFSRRTFSALFTFALVAACARTDATPERASGIDTGFRGVVMTPPTPKPDFTLTDFNGRTFDFRKETEGKVTLLFFGYTHCPDVCPLHVANVAAVLERLPFEERDAIRFVFITTDPERDTPARLEEWLGTFNPGFIGLTGPVEEINRILYGLQMPPAQRDPEAKDSASYLVGHAAQVLAFGKDGMARTEYPFGIRQEDWAHDLPKLARGQVPNVSAADAAATSAPQAALSRAESAAVAGYPLSIHVAAAIVPSPPTTSEGALYVVLRNSGAEDTLTSVWSDQAAKVELHQTMPGDGRMARMAPVKELVVHAGETLQLVPGGTHVMLFALQKKPAVGETLPVRLRFKRSGDLALNANVVAYADVERLLRDALATVGRE